MPTIMALAALIAIMSARAPGAEAGKAVGSDWNSVPDLLKRIAVPIFRQQDFDIKSHGAKGNGTDDDLPALKAAIEACTKAGGGRVIVPPGKYLLHGPIHLKSGVNLHLAAGAMLRFSGEPDHFLPTVETRWEGTLMHGYSPMIYANGAKDIGITGKGVIDGGGDKVFAKWAGRQKADQQNLRRMGAEGTPLDQRRFGKGHWLRPSLVQPFRCQRVLIEGVTLRNGAFWMLHPVLCSDATVRKVRIESPRINNDGCDPDSCERVLIEDCVFRTGDDAIAIKAGRDDDGRKLARPTRDVVIRRCDISSHNGIAIGSEMSGGVHRVFIEDCTIRKAGGSGSGSGAAVFLKATRDRGGVIEGIRVRRLTIDRAKRAVLRIDPSFNHGYRGTNHPTVVRNVLVEDVTCRKAEKFAIHIAGFADMPVQDVTIARMTVDAAETPLLIRHAKGLRFEEVLVNGKPLQVPAATPQGKAGKAE